MISFSGLHLEKGAPIYLQILRFVKQGIVGGLMVDGEELPSRRTLAVLLGVNLNTIQKAYRAMEEEGLIVSQVGAKSLISVSQAQISSLRRELLADELGAMVGHLAAMGLSKEEGLALIGQIWDKEDGL